MGFRSAIRRLGQSGAGRIELNAYDTPRIQLIRQGATYNSQAELIRIGDLNGGWGYASETWGVAMGQYQAGYANITIDPTNGFRLRNYNTTIIQLDNSGNATIAGSLTIGAAGGVYQADGDVWLDDGGLGFDYTIGGDTSSVKWLNSGVVFASIVGMAISGVRGMQFVAQRYQFFDGSNNQVIITTSGVTVVGSITAGGSLVTSGQIGLYVGGVQKGQISVDASWFRINQDVAINIHTPRSFTAYGSIAAGTALIGAAGDMIHTGGLITYRGSYQHYGYAYVPLLSNATWVGGWENTSRTSGTYTVYVENYSGLPFAPIGSYVRAWNIRLVGKPSSVGDAYYMLARDNTAGSTNYSLALRATSAYVQEASGIVHCDANGRFNLALNGTWTGIYVQIIGYYI